MNSYREDAMSSQPPLLSVLPNHAARRFEMQVGDQVAFLTYELDGNHLIIDHTFVPETLRGRGLAAQLVRSVLAHARQQGWKVTAHCSYTSEFIRRHPRSTDERQPD